MDWRSLRAVCLGALFLGALSTLGDEIWARFIPDGAVIPGVMHGILIFLALGWVLAWQAGTRLGRWRLLLGLPLAGCGIAAFFYPLAGAAGYLPALVVCWMLMWLSTACLQRWARDGHESLGRTLLRGIAAAVLSGLAFWAISGIWTQPPPDEGVNHLWRWACWSFAFFPGLAALLVGKASTPP